MRRDKSFWTTSHMIRTQQGVWSVGLFHRGNELTGLKTARFCRREGPDTVVQSRASDRRATVESPEKEPDEGHVRLFFCVCGVGTKNPADRSRSAGECANSVRNKAVLCALHVPDNGVEVHQLVVLQLLEVGDQLIQHRRVGWRD